MVWGAVRSEWLFKLMMIWGRMRPARLSVRRRIRASIILYFIQIYLFNHAHFHFLSCSRLFSSRAVCVFSLDWCSFHLPYIILIPNLSFLGVFILGSRDIRCSKGCNHQSSSSPLLVRSIFFYKKNQDSLWKELFKQHVRFMDVYLKRMNASMK